MSDFFQSVGALGVASRLRSLADRLTDEVNEVYKSEGIDFDAVNFPIFKILADSEDVSLNDIATLLDRTHSAVSQLASKMEKSNLISAKTSTDDARKRIITLTAKGRKLITQLNPVWIELTKVLSEVITTPKANLLDVVSIVEKELEQKHLIERFSGRKNDAFFGTLKIEDFDKRYAAAFYDLNVHWIENTSGLEEGDEEFLKHPEKYVLQKGGMILFAKLSGAVVGTCALVPNGKGRFELARFAIAEELRRRGIGRALCRRAILRAKELGAKTLFLETHSQNLRPGYNLYRSLGFEEVSHPDGKSKYKRVDCYLELNLTK